MAAKGSAKISYVGVWAADAAGCAQIDQPGATGSFAVITVSTFRTGPSACYGNFGTPLADGKGTITMGCPAGGPGSVNLSQSGPDSLQIGDAPAMTRCKP